MKVRDVESGFVLRLEKGEKVIATLADFCQKRGIRAGIFQGIGAVNETEIGYYDLEKKEYFFKTISEDREVASMTGNVAVVYPEGSRGVDGVPFIHAHAVLSAGDESLGCVGGHIKECTVAVTLEVFLTPLPTSLSRSLDEPIGLKLLDI